MPKQHPNEVHQRAVRLVVEHRGEYETEYEAIRSIAAKLGIGSASHAWRIMPPATLHSSRNRVA